MVCAKLDLSPCNYFTGDDWRFCGFGLFWSSNISLIRGVSWQHVLDVTSVFPHWVASYVKTAIQYIWQCVFSLNPAGLIFSLPPLLPLFSFFYVPSSPVFFFFLPFPGVPLSGQGPSIFPQSVVLKAEPLFPATGKHGGRRRQADFLAANSWSMSVWEKAGGTDLMMTEELCILETDFS